MVLLAQVERRGLQWIPLLWRPCNFHEVFYWVTSRLWNAGISNGTNYLRAQTPLHFFLLLIFNSTIYHQPPSPLPPNHLSLVRKVVHKTVYNTVIINNLVVLGQAQRASKKWEGERQEALRSDWILIPAQFRDTPLWYLSLFFPQKYFF